MDMDDLVDQAMSVDLEEARKKKKQEKERIDSTWDDLMDETDGDGEEAFKLAEEREIW